MKQLQRAEFRGQASHPAPATAFGHGAALTLRAERPRCRSRSPGCSCLQLGAPKPFGHFGDIFWDRQ